VRPRQELGAARQHARHTYTFNTVSPFFTSPTSSDFAVVSHTHHQHPTPFARSLARIHRHRHRPSPTPREPSSDNTTPARGQTPSKHPLPDRLLAHNHLSHLQRSIETSAQKVPPSGLALHLHLHLPHHSRPTWIHPQTRRRPPRAAAATLTTPACTPSPPPRSTARIRTTPPTTRARRPHTQTLASAAPTHSPPITPRTGNRGGKA
jgi:hypothetical protein